MASREELYQALRNADSSGDAEGAQKLASYIQSLPSDSAKHSIVEKTPTVIDEVGRQVGLTARAGLKGLGNVVGVFSDPIGGAINKATGSHLLTAGSLADRVSNSVGLPQPQNATENVVQDATSAMASVPATVGVGGLVAKSVSPVAQAVGSAIQAGPGVQTVSGATSAGASGIVRENGGSPSAQLAAGVAGAAAPSLLLGGGSELVRRAMRGGEEGRQAVANNIKLFNNSIGESPSVGQASEQRLPRAIESVLSKTPGGAGVMIRDAQGKADAMANTVRGMADELSPGANPALAGESITKGISGFKEGFKNLQEHLYNKLDQHIPSTTPIKVDRTQAVLKDLNADIPGAPNISEWFKNSKIKGIDAALAADLEAASKPAIRSSVMPTADNPPALPYEAIKKLRTLVGRELADNSLVSDVPRSKWSALYGALSEDLGSAAKSAGPQAQEAWRQANSFSASQLRRLEELNTVVGKDAPEKVFQAAMSGSKDGDTILKRVISAIPKDNRADLAATVLRRMGQANPSTQNAEGTAFSTETFLTNMSKLSPEAQNTLFGRLGKPEMQNKLSELAKIASNVREGSKVFANPSGTQQAISAQAAGFGTLGALLTGHPGVAAAGVVAPVSANILARKMTSPNAVNWLAQKTQISPALAPSELNALSRIYGN